MIPKKTAKKYKPPVSRTFTPRTFDDTRAARLIELVHAHADAGQVDAALEAAISAVVWDGSSSKVRLELARAFYGAGFFREALAWAQGIGEDPEAYFLSGSIQSDLGQHVKAAESFAHALILDPGMIRARFMRASALMASRQYHEALGEINLLLDVYPEDLAARTMRARALLNQGQAHEAMEEIESIGPEHRTPSLAALHARCAMLSGLDPRIVDRIFESYLQRFPRHAQLRLNFARHLSSRKDVDPAAIHRAEKELNTILGMKNLPRRIEAGAWFLLAELKMDSDEEKALQLFQEGLNLMPDHPQGLAGVGGLFLRRFRPDRAMPWLLRAIMSAPDRQESIESLAQALAGIVDEDAVGRWLALLFSGLPTQAPLLMARVLGHVQDKGRADAYLDVRRLAHRMKNRVAVLAARVRAGLNVENIEDQLNELYEQWADFLDSMQTATVSGSPLAVENIVNKAISQTAENPESLLVGLQPDLPLVSGNEQQLVDAVANIISNALQASASDSKVKIAARSIEGGDFVEIAVMDHGQGMDSSFLSRIFSPGYTTRAKGSGLGLFIARNVVQSHGGRVSVHSAPGGPTTFTIRLPAVAGGGNLSMDLDELMGAGFEGGRVVGQR